MSNPFVQSQLESHARLAPQLPGAQLGWLRDARALNLAAFAAGGLPTPRCEQWKYTALKALEKRTGAVGDAQAASRVVDPASLELPGVDGPRLVFVNGAFRADLSRLDRGIDAALHVVPLSQALDSGADGLCFFLSRHFREAHQGLAGLNAAFAGDGAVVRVAPGARIEAPLHLVFAGTPADADIAWYARNLIDVGEGAALRVIEHYVGSGAHAQFGNIVNQVELKAGAAFCWLRVQDESEGASLVARTEFTLGERAELVAHNLDLGAALTRNDTIVELAGAGARVESRGVFALHGRQHADTQLAVHHAARDTVSDLLWRGVADARSRGVFNGTIVVRAGADGSDARLSNKNLLLSPHAEIDTKPVLEIHADEVKAAHGATVGQLDERALFYLRSRGLPAVEARSLLTFAFCRETLDGIRIAPLREHLAQRLVEHLPRHEPEPNR